MQAHSATAAPVRKVAAGGLAAAITTVLVYVLEAAFSISIPAEVAAALTTLIGFVVAYLTPPGANEVVTTSPTVSPAG
jgi:putative flippase GtrA